MADHVVWFIDDQSMIKTNSKTLWTCFRCQEVLKKSEETRAQSEKTADNPLSVAAMNSLMSMEVKLQTNLTDQNSKFIKVLVVSNFKCP